MTKKKLIIFGAVFAIGALIICFLTGKKSGNQLYVTVDSSLSVDKVRIDYGFYSINSGSDENLIKIGLDQVIYTDKTQKDFETICGENDFLIVYDNEYYTIIRHFIPNDFYDAIPSPHNYNFGLKKIRDQIYLNLYIEGEDGDTTERALVNTSDANNNIWGRPMKTND